MQIKKVTSRRAIYTLYIIALLDLLAVSLFLPLLSREIKNLGASPFLVGIVGSVYGGIQLFSSPIVGSGSDQYGRKIIFIVMLAASAFAYIIQGSATSLAVMLIARSLAGMFKHTQTISKTILADLAPNEKSFVFGNVNAFGSMGYIVGPTIGGHLVEYGFCYVCYLAAGIFLLNILLLSLLVPETLPPKIEKESPKFRNNNKDGSCCDLNVGTMSRGTLFTVLLLRFLFSFATLAPRANLPLVLDNKFNASVVSQGYLNSLQALVGTLTGFCVGPLCMLYREKHKPMVLHGGIIHMISLLGLYFAPTFFLSGLALTVISAVNPMQRVGIAAMSLTGTIGGSSTILGLGQTATSLARMLAPAMAGLAQTYSDDGPALLGVISALLGILCTIFMISMPASSSSSSSSVYVKEKTS